MLVAVIADTHMPRGGRRLPQRCVDRLRAADLILHAGDVVAEPVFEELAALGPPVHAVHGNMDEPGLCERLPATLVVDVAGLRIGLTHDPGPRAGREERLAARFPGCAAVVYGHTHEPQVARVGETWILNPGSPTEQRRAPAHTMLVLEVAGETMRPELIPLTSGNAASLALQQPGPPQLDVSRPARRSRRALAESPASQNESEHHARRHHRPEDPLRVRDEGD